jgi:isopentenyl diphosphate isomerase/L-lactate dehydrogenase-like FMN-dependent dehydrogenase
VSAINTSTEVLGVKMDYPIMIAPTAGHSALHPDGELATHKGATAASSTPMIVSINTSYPIDKVAAAADGPLWFQLYSRDTPDANREIVQRAVGAGCRAIVLTADVQLHSHRERALHNRNLLRSATPRRTRPTPETPLTRYRISGQTPYIDWGIIGQLREMTKVPLLVKGILTAEDGAVAVERGFDGVIVSNHGGRYLDYAPSTLEVLAEIVDAVKGRIPVIVDSGFRRGADVAKALALVLEIVQRELVHTMKMIGGPTLASLDRSAVKTDFA